MKRGQVSRWIEATQHLATAISHVYNLLDIECTIFAGGAVSDTYPELKKLERLVTPLVHSQMRPIMFRRAALGNTGVLQGAALLTQVNGDSMMNICEMIQQANAEHWAIGQFNISNLETLQAIVAAANEANSPVLVGVSMGSLRHIGLSYLEGLILGARSEATVPLYFHLDHGANFEAVKSCIEIGFDSVMIDASRFVWDENIRQVREVVAFAHARGVGVEAQVGETWDEETGEQVETRTEPAQVRPYAEATGIDYLAISFGNTPGRTQGAADVDVGLIQACAAESPVPIVLHGGTSIPDSAMQTAIQSGAAKVNIDTAIRQAISTTLSDAYGQKVGPPIHARCLRRSRHAVKETVIGKMDLFGSAGRA